MNESPQIVIRIVSDPHYLCVIRGALETALKVLGMEEAQSHGVVLAVDEAVTNVIRHAYLHEKGRPITLSLSKVVWNGEPAVEMKLEDESVGVDLTKIRSRDLDDVRPGGLGVHIISATMDAAQYSHMDNGRGVCLKMTKRLGCEKRSESGKPG
jgi:anti-sigma regulatory factor (Ser/Thr protein kinase)